MQKFLYVMVGVLISLTSMAESTTGSPLSLDQAIELGLKRSEDVQIAAADLVKAEAQIREAWAAAFPNINANAGVTHYLEAPVIQMPDGSGGINEIPIKQDYEVSMGLQVQQVLWAFGRVGNALELAKVGKEAQEQALEAARRELRYQVTLTYYRVLLAQDLQRIAEESLSNATSNKRSLEARFQGGRVPRYDNIKMASDIASREPRLADAKKQLDLAYLSLNLLLDLPTDQKPTLTTKMGSDFASFETSEILDRAKQNDVNLKLTESALEVSETLLKLEKSKRLPMLSATLGANRTGTGPSLDIDSGNYTNTVSAGVVLTIPIWEGGAHSARQKQAQVEVSKAQYKLDKYNKTLRLQVESALASYRADVQTYKAAAQAKELAQETYDLTRTRFRTGGATQKELNDVEMGLTGAKQQLRSTLMGIYQSKAQIEKLIEEVKSI